MAPLYYSQLVITESEEMAVIERGLGGYYMLVGATEWKRQGAAGIKHFT